MHLSGYSRPGCLRGYSLKMSSKETARRIQKGTSDFMDLHVVPEMFDK
jgi:hypothetical protein